MTVGLAMTASCIATVTSAQTRDWSPDDRAVIGDFSRITAVAITRDRVYAVTPTAILEWDPQSRRWRGPWQPRPPELLQDVSVALADPLDGGIWMVRRGGWLRFDPALQLWEQGSVPGAVVDAALDASAPVSGLFLRTAGGWYLAQRGGIALPGSAPTRPIRAASVNDAVRSNPALRANSAFLPLSNRLGGLRFTAAARGDGFTGQGWYVGTSGAALLYLADGAGLPDILTFGLPSDAVDAVFAGTGGVWAVTERTQLADPALSFVATDFHVFQWLTGPRATGLPFTQARRVVGRESDLWLATDGGIVRVTPKSNEVSRLDQGRGLPDPRVLDLVQRRGRVVAATSRGLASFTDSGGLERVAPGFSDAALAVALSGDTVWVGTRLGLFASVPGSADLLQPDGVRVSAEMQRMVVDLTWRADTLVALLQDRLLWRDPRTGQYSLGPLLGGALGRLHTVVSGDRGVYVAGDRGVGFARLDTPVQGTFTEPGDLPGQVTDLAVDDTYLWVATLRGLVRLRLDVIGR
jgi:ligand-binding sensor domain-containing protein